MQIFPFCLISFLFHAFLFNVRNYSPEEIIIIICVLNASNHWIKSLDENIVNDAIRALTSNLTLRNVLDAASNLTLGRLLHFLEAHFNERNTTDLWSKLTSQLPEQSSYSFVLRRIELRQKVLIASRKSYIKFDKRPPDKVFCTYLEGGLSRIYVVQEIRHLLRTGLSDEALTTEVTKCRGKRRNCCTK